MVVVRSLNAVLDTALKEDGDTVEATITHPGLLQTMIYNYHGHLLSPKLH